MLRAGAGPIRWSGCTAADGLPEWTSASSRLMAEQHEVIVPEHPGFGKSDNPPWLRNVGDLAMHYLDFLETLGHARVHLAGHALGGWIAAEVAVRNTSRLAASGADRAGRACA